MADAEAFKFEVNWYDQQADITRQYQLTVMQPMQGPLEATMFDIKSKRIFLKRMPIMDLRIEDLYVGSTVTINSRQLKVQAYSDPHTKNTFEARRDSVVVLTSQNSFQQLGQIIDSIEQLGLTISRLRLVNDNGPVVAMQVIGRDAELRFQQEVVNSFTPGAVRQVSPVDGNAFFEDRHKYPGTASGDHCTLCVIRPHALKAGNAGAIITSIMEAGFEISAAATLQLERAQAVELFEVYQNVVPYFSDLIASMTEAPCLALELRKELDVVEDFRRLCGTTYDVDMARHLRPGSLRARFGVDNARNGVHATDLEEDAEREVRYVFEILGN
mmetsp:Transcript_47169/g.93857  ORF Transcript_47169/g.93857 Transcript_47169/m.93857 type:complete len:329 (+) Transcript_47169:73-1059(+)